MPWLQNRQPGLNIPVSSDIPVASDDDRLLTDYDVYFTVFAEYLG
jgi:hypothetical protein